MRKTALAFAAGLAAGWGLCRLTIPARPPQPDGPVAPAVSEVRPPSSVAEHVPSERPRRPSRDASPLPESSTDAAATDPDASADDADLAEIETAARDGTEAKRVFNMAMVYAHSRGAKPPAVPPRLVQELMARGGDFDKAGGELFGCMSDADARAELRALAAGPSPAWGSAEHQDVIARGLVQRFRVRPGALSDDEVSALSTSKRSALRGWGIRLAAQRGLLSWDAALVRARTDPDAEVRGAALSAAFGAAAGNDAALDAVGDEIVAFARSDDAVVRAAGLEMLGVVGAKGAAVAREIIDQGGLDADAYESAVKSLLAARRFDRLAPEGLDEDSRCRLVRCLYDTYSDDASTRTQVIEAIRAMGTPTGPDEVEEIMCFAADADATDLVADVAKNRAAPAAVRARALHDLVAEDASSETGVRLAAEFFAEPATTPSDRRAVLEEAGRALLGRGDAGVAVVRRVAEHDTNAQVRGVAARQLRDAGK
jgi:hypothetical protein